MNKRFAEWLNETKGIMYGSDIGGPETSDRTFWYTLTLGVVFALLTIAIAVHEAAEAKK